MVRRGGVRWAVVVLVAGALAGCSSSADKAESGLLAMLGKVQATDVSRQYIEYGDLDRERELTAEAPNRARGIQGFGLGSLASYYKLIDDSLGLDLLGMSRGIDVGIPPNGGGLVLGDYDLATVNQRFADRKLQRTDRDGATYWSAGRDDEINLDGPLADLAPLTDLTKIRTVAGSFAYSRNSATLGWVTAPSGATLADDPAIRDLASCLGDVVIAQFSVVGTGKLMVAVGVRAPSAAHATSVICAEAGAKDRASQLQQRASTRLLGETSDVVPWATVLPVPKVELAGLTSGTVRILSAIPQQDDLAGVMRIKPKDLGALFGA